MVFSDSRRTDISIADALSVAKFGVANDPQWVVGLASIHSARTTCYQHAPQGGCRKTAPGGPKGPPDSSALEGTRTPNLLVRSQMLYPLSYERLRVASLEARPMLRLLVCDRPHHASGPTYSRQGPQPPAFRYMA